MGDGPNTESDSPQEKFYQGLRDQAKGIPNLRPEIKKTLLGEEAEGISSPAETPAENQSLAIPTLAESAISPEENRDKLSEVQSRIVSRAPKSIPQDKLNKDLQEIRARMATRKVGSKK
jgi:hypothetical protein